MCQTGLLEYKYCVVLVLIFSIFCPLLSDVESIGLSLLDMVKTYNKLLKKLK